MLPRQLSHSILLGGPCAILCCALCFAVLCCAPAVRRRRRIDGQLGHIRAALLSHGSSLARRLALSCRTVAGLNGAPRAFITHRLRVGWRLFVSRGGEREAGATAAAACGPDPTVVEAALLHSSTPIALITWRSEDGSRGGVDICAHFLQSGEEVTLARRLLAELTAPRSSSSSRL